MGPDLGCLVPELHGKASIEALTVGERRHKITPREQTMSSDRMPADGDANEAMDDRDRRPNADIFGDSDVDSDEDLLYASDVDSDEDVLAASDLDIDEDVLEASDVVSDEDLLGGAGRATDEDTLGPGGRRG